LLSVMAIWTFISSRFHQKMMRQLKLQAIYIYTTVNIITEGLCLLPGGFELGGPTFWVIEGVANVYVCAVQCPYVLCLLSVPDAKRIIVRPHGSHQLTCLSRTSTQVLGNESCGSVWECHESIRINLEEYMLAY
jgi:hypothetical protein